MADSNLTAYVSQDTLGAAGENTWANVRASKRGDLVMINWYQQMAMEGRIFQVRAGTITTPLVGDVVITDTAAEMSADAPSGTTIIPCYLNIGIRLGTGTLHEYAAKSIGVVAAAAGATGFTPLNLLMGGSASTSTARVAAAGGVTVTAELATTTRRHWNAANPVAVGAGNTLTEFQWAPIAPPVDVGPAQFYVQIAATTTGPSYYANFDFVELPTTAVS